MYRFEPDVNAGESSVPEDRIDEDLLDQMSENFLDTVYGNSSKLDRKDYMDSVAKKAPWIFSSKGIRDEVNKIKPL